MTIFRLFQKIGSDDFDKTSKTIRGDPLHLFYSIERLVESLVFLIPNNINWLFILRPLFRVPQIWLDLDLEGFLLNSSAEWHCFFFLHRNIISICWSLLTSRSSSWSASGSWQVSLTEYFERLFLYIIWTPDFHHFYQFLSCKIAR